MPVNLRMTKRYARIMLSAIDKAEATTEHEIFCCRESWKPHRVKRGHAREVKRYEKYLFDLGVLRRGIALELLK